MPKPNVFGSAPTALLKQIVAHSNAAMAAAAAGESINQPIGRVLAASEALQRICRRLEVEELTDWSDTKLAAMASTGLKLTVAKADSEARIKPMATRLKYAKRVSNGRKTPEA